MTGTVRFWFRGEVVELTDAAPTRSVLHWLREDAGAVGTKEGCNSGDCGACTVVLAESSGSQVRTRTANACLLPLPALHEKVLLTIEDVGAPGHLHPVQRAMVDHAGSQCGFCTPGFVMSMWHRVERGRGRPSPSREELADELTGNLCRCTGYRPILDAAVEAARVTADGESPLAEPALRTALATVTTPGALAVTTTGGAFLAPETEEQLSAELAAHPHARVVSGGTDLVLAMRASGEWYSDEVVLVSTARVASLSGAAVTGTHLRIGAATDVERTWQALVERQPSLDRMRRRFAGPAIRSTGTVGGNLANASPVADLVPVLLALDAVVELRSVRGSRSVPVDRLATGVRRTVLAHDEYLAAVEVPLAALERTVLAHKVSRRFDDDISTVSLVVAADVRPDGTVADARVVVGGMATTVRRVLPVEEVLRGGRIDDASLAAGLHALADELRPIDDHRASAGYRTRAAEALLARVWRELSGHDGAVHDVWDVRA